MSLIGLEVTNSRSQILNLPLEDILAGFIVKNISGLDPVKATLVSSSFANMDGEQYHSSRREPRNIVITLGLDPDYSIGSVEKLRSQLYNFFMPKTSVLLKFNLFDKFAVSDILGSASRYIQGRIETCETPLFSKDPEIEISIMCFNPDFYDLDLVSVDGLTVATAVETLYAYDGTVDTGVVFTLSFDRSLDAFTLYHRTPDGILKSMDVAYAFLAGDILKISTVVGDKSALLTRASVESSILYAVTPQSNWMQLEPGDNNVRVYAVGAGIPYNIQYVTKYGGL